MNKIFKVVWSKTKECYVVVSEVAKNNGGKKKVLASVLAGLAMVGAGAQVQAYSGLGGHDDPSVETLAVGPDTWANQEAAVAVGMHNNANGRPAGKHSVAIGNFSNANGEISIAMGGVTNASGKMSVAVGYQASATDEAAVALGNMVSADKNSTGVGPGAIASGTYAFAGGYQSETTGISGVAIGDNAKAKAARAMAIGGHAEATAEQAIAIGSDTGAGNKTTASKKNAIAVGHGATASGLDTAAIGTSATASGQSSVALGNGTQSTNLNTTAIGSNVQSTKTGSIGIGGNVESIGDYSVAIGSASAGKTVKAVDYATAVGGLSNAAERAAALGAGADAAQARSVAIGYRATASTADGVAIGSTSVASTAAGVQGFNPADSRTNKYSGLTSAAQTSTLAAVSIGNGSAQTRQITGLAAGKEDTDAVNVAQLRSVNLKYAADTGSNDFLLTDGTLTVNGDGDLISTSVEPTGVIKVTAKKGGNITHTDGKAVKPTTNGIATTDNVADAINDSYWKATAGGNTVGTVGVGNVKPGNKVTFSAGDNLKVKQSLNNTTGEQEYTYSLNPVLTGITSIANTTGGPTMTFGGNSINITGGSLNMGNSKITNLAPGTDDKDAVNVKQLKDTELHITPGTYTPDANKKVKLTYTDGNSTVVAGKEAVIDLSGLATGGTASTEKVKKAANGADDTNIAEVNPQTGDTFGGAGATYEVSVSRNAVKDAAREAVTVNNGGTTTGGTYTADTNNPISVTAVPDNTNHNTTYAVTFDGNKAAKQIPLTYKATNGTTTTADQTVKLDKGLNFTGGDYTTASVGADGKVTFDVNLGTTPTVTDGKPGVPGQAGAAGKDGIATVKTVVDTINNSGWKANAKANGGTLVGNSTATVVKPGDQVNFAAGKNLTVKQDLTGEHTYTYSLNKDIDLTNTGSVTTGNTKVDNGGVTITAPTGGTTTDVKLTNTGLDNGGNKIVNVAEGKADTDAVNVKQLKDAKTVLADGKNTTKSGSGTVADPYKVNVEGDLTGISSITNGGTNNGKISFGPNKTVTVDGDHSITLNASTGKIGGLQNKTFDPTNFTSGQAATEDQLKSVHDTLKASELHIAPTASTLTNEHLGGTASGNTAAGAATQAYKYDATTKQVVLEYNDGTGANKTGTKAVIDLSNLPTGGDMSSFKVTSSAESATVGTHAGDASQEIKNGKSVDFQAGKNMTVTQTNDNGNGNTTINYALNKDLDVESVHVGKDGKDGKIGIDGKDGVDGLNGTNRVDIHVEKGAKGVDGTDGHDGVNGHNGKDGMTRIVYEDKGGKQEVATLNDGMKYAGDDAQGTDKTKVIAKKLNETLDIIGGANKADLTTDNIGVNNDGNGKLLVQLSKNLKGINTIKNGNTTITLNDTPSTTTPAVTITGGNLSLGDGTTNNKIVNVAPGTDDTDAVNYKQLKDAKTVLADGKNTTKSGTGTATDPYKVNVEGDLTEITSITNKADASGNAGKITFSPNQTVTVSGDHNISLNGKTGDITGLTNTTIPTTAGSDFATKGRAATEEQLKIVNDKFNNKINLGADGNTETNKLALDNATGIKFNIKGDGSGTSGANQYISTTASGSDIKVDLTADAKAKLNNKVVVAGSGAATVAAPTVTTNPDGTTVTTYTVHVDPATATAASTEKVKKAANGANDTNIAEVNPKTGDTFGGAGATYEVSVSRNAVKDAAREAVTVNNGGTTTGGTYTADTNNPISVTAVPDNTNHNTTYAVTFDGNKAAKQIPLTYKATNGTTTTADQTVKLDKGLNFTGGDYTTASVGADGKVTFDVNLGTTPTVTDGKPGVPGQAGAAGKDGIATVKTVVDTINNSGWKANAKANGGTLVGNSTATVVKPGDQVNFAAGKNLTVKQDLTGEHTYTYSLNKDIDLTNTGSVTTGNTKVDNGGVTITAPTGGTTTDVKLTNTGLDNGGNKIVNVAEGKADTDAVNVKQLKDAKTVLADGKNTTKSGSGTAADPYKVNVEGDLTEITSITNKADASGNAGKITFSPNQTVTVDGDHSITLNASTGKIGGLQNKTFDPTNFTSGQAATEDQLKSVHDTLKASERHIAPTTVAAGSTENKGGTANAAGTANVYKYDAASKTVTLTYNDGNGNAVTDTKAVIDLSNLSTGGTGASSWNVKSSANTTDGGAVDANHNANAQNIADGKSVEFQAGKNLVVKQTNDTTNGNATVEFSLSDKITVGKDGANGKDGSVGAKGADGSAVVMNGADGSIGLNGTNGANGISIKGKDGANGVGIDGKDGVTRIVYTEKVPDPANPGTTKEVTHEVATMDDGLKFTGNNTGTVNKHKLGSLVKVQGEGVSATDEAAFVSASGNIAVTAENNDTLTIRLNKNLKGLNSIQLGGNTIQSNGDNITFTTNGGTTKTVATTDQLWTIQANGIDVPATNGKVNVVGKDGITVAKNAAGNLEISGAGLGKMNSFDVTANNGATSKTIDNGKKVDFNAGSNLTVKQTNDATGTHIEYALKEAVDLGPNGSLKAGDTTINKDGVTIANGPSITKNGVDAGNKKITNVADGAVNATSKDAVNGSQLYQAMQDAKTHLDHGQNTTVSGTGTQADPYKVNVQGDLNKISSITNNAGDGKVKFDPNQTVTVAGDHNISLNGKTGDITGLTNTSIGGTDFATKGRAATEEQLKEAMNSSVEKVKKAADGANDKNIAEVNPTGGATNYGKAGTTYEVSVSRNAVENNARLSYTHNGNPSKQVTLSEGLNFKNGTNTTARTEPNGQVFYDVNPNLQNISSISGSTTDNGPRISFNNAGSNSTVQIEGGNLDMSDHKIVRLTPGTNATDAATVGQLTKINSTSTVIAKNVGTEAAPVYELTALAGGTVDNTEVNMRIDQLGEEIGRVGAQGAALSALKPIQYDPLEPTQIMAGYGNYRGNSAVALGVAHYKNESTLIHGGVSWAGGSSHMMANAGVTWKVGNRDSEAAVADRYRKGPISSAYAMQQEMAAMKAQNAGLKGEVSDLKAENEQMKAQIAAMMAKLGL